MRLLLFLKPWLLMLLLFWELDISDTSDADAPELTNYNSLVKPKTNSKAIGQDETTVPESHGQLLCKIKIFVLGNDGNVEFVDSSQYKLLKSKNLLKLRFNDGLKCIKLKHGDQNVWIHNLDQYGYHYPREFVLSEEEITVEIRNLSLTYVCNKGKWILFSTTTYKSSSFKDFTVVTSDDPQCSKLRFNDSSQYDLLSYPNGMKMFLFKDNARCVEFRLDKNTVWKLELDKHNARFPTSIVYKPDATVFVNFDPYYLVYEFDTSTGKWKLNNDKSYRVPGLVNPNDHPHYLTVVTSDNEDGSDLKFNDTSQYKLYSYFDNLYLYLFESNVKCHEFRFRDFIVWTYDNTKDPPRFPRSISVDLVDSVIDIEFGDQTLRFRLSGSGFISYTVKDDLGSQTPVSKHVAEQTSDDDSEQVTETQSQKTQDARDFTAEDLPDFKHKLQSKSLRTSEPKAPGRVEKPVKEPQKPKASSQPSVSQPTKPAVMAVQEPDESKVGEAKVEETMTKEVLKPVDAAEPTKLKSPATPSTIPSSVDSTPKPASRPKESASPPKSTTSAPEKVEVTTPEPKASEESKVITEPKSVSEQTMTNEPDASTPTDLVDQKTVIQTTCQPKPKDRTPIPLDIEKESGDHFNFTKKNTHDLRIYTAKEGYLFNKVVKNDSRSMSSTQKVIWEAEDELKYLYQVILKGSGDKPKYLALLPVNDDFILYYLGNKDSKWRDITSTRISFSDFSFFGTDQSSSELKKLDHTSCYRSTYNFMFYYKFKDGVNCTEIKHNNESLWTQVNGKSYPNGLYLNLLNNKLYLLLADEKVESLKVPTIPSTSSSDSTPASKSTQDSESTPYIDAVKEHKDLISKSEDHSHDQSKQDILTKPKTESEQIKHSDKKAISLDIKIKKSNDKLDFSKNESEDLRIYSAKQGYLFDLVKKYSKYSSCSRCGTIIWEAQNKDQFVYQVILKGSGDKPKYLALLPIVGDFFLYYKEKKGSDWRNITPFRLSFSDFSFLGFDKSGSGIRELNSTNYDRSFLYFLFGYKFKDGVKCVEIKYRDASLWRHSGDPQDPLPVGFYYELCDINLYVLLKSSTWELVRTQIGVDIETAYSNFYETSRNYAKNTMTFTAKDEYLFRIVRQGSDVIWQTDDLTDNVKKILYEGINQQKKKITVFLGNGTKRFFIRLSKAEPWKEISDPSEALESTAITPKPSPVEPLDYDKNLKTINPYLPKLKIFTERSSRHNDTRKYQIKVTPDAISYKFNRGTRCTEIKYVDNTIWKHGKSTHEDDYPLYVFFHNDIKRLYVINFSSMFVCSLEGVNSFNSRVNVIDLDIKRRKTNDHYEFFKDPITKSGVFIAKDNTIFEDIWRGKRRLSCGEDDVLYESKFYYDCVYKVVIHPLGFKDKKVTLHLVNGRVITLLKDKDYSYLKLWAPFGPRELSIITKDSKFPNDFTKYDIFSEADIFQYVFKREALCTEVKLKDKTIWKYGQNDHKDYPKSFLFDKAENRFLFNYNMENIVFKKKNGTWRETRSKLSTIDINTSQSTNKYSFSKNNTETVTFEAKPSYGFTKVIEKSSSLNCLGSDTVIWEAQNTDQFAISVTRDGAGCFESLQQVEILLSNGDVLKYSKTGGCIKKWILDDLIKAKSTASQQPSSPNDHRQNIKPSKAVVLDVHSQDSNDQYYYKMNSISTYSPTDGFGFKKVILTSDWCGSDEVIWEAKNKSEYAMRATRNGAGFFESLKQIEITLSNGDVLKYKRNGSCFQKKWTLEETILAKRTDSQPSTSSDDSNQNKETTKPIILDVHSKEFNNDYDYQKDTISTYDAKKGYGFTKVIEKSSSLNCFGSDTVIWEAENSEEYATKVIRDGTGACKKLENVAIHLTNGDVLKYTKSGGCFGKQWILVDIITSDKSKALKIISPSDDSNQKKETIKPVVLDIYSLESNYNYKYSTRELSNFGTFKAKEGHGFNKIVQRGSCFTECSIFKYICCLFSCFKSSCCFSDCFSSDCCYSDCWDSECCYSDPPEEETTTCCLFGWLKSDCIDFDCCDSEECDFECFSSNCLKNHVIWESDNRKEHATKLVIDGLGNFESPENLYVYLSNHDVLKYEKTGDRKNPWKLVKTIPHDPKTTSDSDRSFTCLLNSLKIYTLDSSDNSNSNENDSSQYVVNDFNNMFKYVFEPKAKCVRIKYCDDTVWNHVPNTHYPKVIYYFKYTLTLIVEFENDKFVSITLPLPTTDNKNQ